MDVYEDISRDISVNNWLDLEVQGSNPTKLQWNHTPYLDRGITISNSIVTERNDDDSFAVVPTFTYKSDGRDTTEFFDDICGTHVENYHTVHTYHYNVFEDISREVNVQNWVVLQLNGVEDNTYFIQVGNSYTDPSITVIHNQLDIVDNNYSSTNETADYSANSLISLSGDHTLDDPSYVLTYTFTRNIQCKW